MSFIKHARCPVCSQNGKDTRGDNLAVYDDHSFCFSCGYINNDWKVKVKGETPGRSVSPIPSKSIDQSNLTFNIPKVAQVWLDSYGITREEQERYNICYDTKKDLLVFPLYDGNDNIVASCRYFGEIKIHPKYLTYKDREGFYKIFRPKNGSDVVVLVEDVVSAIKVGRQFCSIPLLGIHAPDALFFSLKTSNTRLRIWLDPDVRDKTIQMSKRAGQYIEDRAIILSDFDPKDYSDKAIFRIVNDTLVNEATLMIP